MTKMLWILWALLTTGLAATTVWLWRDKREAQTRADIATQVLEQHLATDSLYKDSVDVVMAAQDDSVATLLAASRGSAARADSMATVAHASEVEIQRLMHHQPALERAFATYRAQRDSADVEYRHAVETCHRAIAVLQHKDDTRAVLLARTTQRLAEALVGWRLSEKARAPSAADWATRALAIIGAERVIETMVRIVF